MINNDNGWRCYQHCYIRKDYETPVQKQLKFSQIEKQYLQDNEKKDKAFFAQYITAFDVTTPTKWWFTIKDDEYNLSTVKSKRRYEITKAKKFCYSKTINACDYTEQLFECYKESFTAYPEKYRPTYFDIEEFKTECEKWDSDRNQKVYAVFYTETNMLIGFCIVIERGKFLNLSQVKTNPNYEKYNSNAALIDYMLNDWNTRLSESDIIISNGSRNIKHETNFNAYLEKYFGFRKAYCNLKIVYKFPFGIIIKLLKPFKKIIMNSNNSILYNLYCVLKLDDFATKP